MKIGIYGDSYAGGDVSLSSNWINTLVRKIENDVGKKISYFQYALGGSSLYYSYKKFIETNNEYDLVIFLVTEPHRYYDPVLISGSKIAITGLGQLEHFKNNFSNLDEKTIKLLDNLIGWFNMSSEKFNDDMSDLMIDKIETIRPDAILYPCFPHSFKKERFLKYNLDPLAHPCHSFWHKQLKIFNIDCRDFTAKEKNTLFGHLVPEFNEFFANVIYEKYKTGKYNVPSYDNITIEKTKEHYYGNWD